MNTNNMITQLEESLPTSSSKQGRGLEDMAQQVAHRLSRSNSHEIEYFNALNGQNYVSFKGKCSTGRWETANTIIEQMYSKHYSVG